MNGRLKMNNMHDCKYEKVIDIIDKRLDRLESKIDDLRQYKWQIMGGAGVLGVILTFLVNFIIRS